MNIESPLFLFAAFLHLPICLIRGLKKLFERCRAILVVGNFNISLLDPDMLHINVLLKQA